MDTAQDINTVEWFFGYGGNHLGLKRVLPNLRLLAACEIEEFAVENILAKMEAGLLEAAPIWSDCKTFPWEPFVDRTHLFVASYPCQPFSAAGKRQGTEDERHLWPYVYRWILRARPLLVFLENVEGHVSLGLSTVISDLEEGGYKAAWGIFSASEVGAPHQRKRVFILAYDQRQRIEELGRQIAVGSQQHSAWDDGGMEHAATNGREYGQTLGSGDGSRNHSPELWEELGFGCLQAWPSRPGEQQFAWEPPRVVVDAKSQRAGQRSELCGEECGSRSALSWDVEQSGEGAVANDHSPHAGHGEQRPERTLEDLSGGCGEAMGNTSSQRCEQNTALRGEQQPSGIGEECRPGVAEAMGNASQRQDHGRESRDLGLAPSQRGSGDHAADGAGEVLGNAARLPAGGTRSEQNQSPEQRRRRSGHADSESATQHDSQTQPPLGRDADGPADWLDNAELYVTCDNRTDELRLLGNGVVPQTCERAFRVLVGELMEHQP